MGGHIFLWLKLFEDIVERKKGSDPYKLYHRISQVKDLNKLAELVPLPYSKLKLENYFSDDVFDAKWIPKNKWKPNREEIDYERKFRENDF